MKSEIIYRVPRHSFDHLGYMVLKLVRDGHGGVNFKKMARSLGVSPSDAQYHMKCQQLAERGHYGIFRTSQLKELLGPSISPQMNIFAGSVSDEKKH